MEFRCRTTEPQPRPQFREHQPQRPPVLSGHGCVAEQFISAGYRKPGSGAFNDHFGQGIGHNHECFRQATGWANGYFQISSDVCEEIQRSIEKERIRDEIIATEIARRQALEAEVRAEIRMERELALRVTGGYAFNRFLFPLGAGMVSEPKGSTFQQEAKGLEERVAMYAGERLRMGTRGETQVFDSPFLQSVVPEAKEITFTPSHMENSKQKEKIVFLVKSTASFSGAKRKVISPAEESENTEGKESWSCAICQVNTNSERVLKDHFQGKRHKSKEAALRAERNGCDIGLGVSPCNAVKPIIEETHVLSSLLVDGKALPINQSALNSLQGLKLEREALQINQSEPSSLHTVSTEYLDENSISILQEKKDKLKNEKLVGVQKAPKSKLKEKENFTFWCDMCQVGTYCEIVMEDHRKGKKHLKLFKKARENGLANLTSQIVDIHGANVSDETPKEGDKKAFENVDGTSPKEDVQYFDVNGIQEKEDYEAAKGAVGTLNS